MGWNFNGVSVTAASVAATAGHRVLQCASLGRTGVQAPAASDLAGEGIFLGGLGFNWDEENLVDAFHSFGWPAAFDDAKYVEFTVALAPDSTAQVSLQSITAFVFFAVDDIGDALPQWWLRSSRDDYAADIDGAKIPQQDQTSGETLHRWGPVTFELTGHELSARDPTDTAGYTFRLYAAHPRADSGVVDQGMAITKRRLQPPSERVHTAVVGGFDLRVTGTVTIPPTVSFGSASYTVREAMGTRTAEIEVTLAHPSDQVVTVPINVVDAGTTAVAGDYSLAPTSVTFPANATGADLTRAVTLTATDDTEVEDDETVLLGFGTLPAGVLAGTTAQTTVTIVSDDTNSAAMGLPAVTGTVRVGQTLAVDTSAITDDDGLGAFSYRWQAGVMDGSDGGWTDIVSASSATLRLVEPMQGRRIRVVVSFTDGAGNAESLASLSTAPVAPAPAATITAVESPVTEGAPARFELLLAVAAPAGGLTLNVAVADAPGSDFVAADDEGATTVALAAGNTTATLSVPTTADTEVEADGPVTATLQPGDGYTVGSPASAAVTIEEANNAAMGLPAVTGTVWVGQTLAVDTAAITDDDGLGAFSYRWQTGAGDGSDSGWTDVASASSATLRLVEAMQGRRIRVAVSFTDGAGHAERLASLPTAPVASAPAATIAAVESPVTEGAPARFELRLAAAAPAGGLTLNVAVADAPGSDFVADADEGATTVALAAGHTTATLGVPTAADTEIEADGPVTATLQPGAGYTVGSPASAAVTIESDDAPPPNRNAPATGAPVISGDARVGYTLTAHTDAIADADGLGPFSYRWQAGARDGSDGGWTDVASASSATLRLVEAMQGRRIRVAVSFTDGAGHAERLASLPTAPVASAPAATIAAVESPVPEGAPARFELRLAAAAPAGGLTLNVAVADAPGSDFVADADEGATTVALAAGHTTATLGVPTTADTEIEADGPVTATLQPGAGYAVGSPASAAVTIESDDAPPLDPVAAQWLARFGSTVAEQVLDAVGARLDGAAPAGSRVTIAGRRIERGAARAAALDDAGCDRSGRGGSGRPECGAPWRAMTVRELLTGSSFHLSLDGSGTDTPEAEGRLTLWGRAAATGFDREDGDRAFDGTAVTGGAGVDYEHSRLLAGVAAWYGGGEGAFAERELAGEAGASLIALTPYLSYRPHERLTVWGVVGYGEGDLALTWRFEDLDGEVSRPVSMKMGALGARGELVAPAAAGGLGLALETAALLVRMDAAAADGLPATGTDTSRLRATLDGRYEYRLAGGTTLTPRLEVGVRHDGGDAETGEGLEVGVGLRYVLPAVRLTAEARARALVAHAEHGYREWGASASVSFGPGAGGRGLSVTLQPSWGVASGGDGAAVAGYAGAGGPGRLGAELGYGFGALDGPGLVTPYGGVTLSEGRSRSYRLGSRLEVAPWFDLSLEGQRRERAPAPPEHDVTLRGALRW